MCPIVKLLVFFSLAIASSFASAQSSRLQIDRIVTEQLALRSQLQSGSGSMGELSPARRVELLGKQEKMLGMLEGKHSDVDLTSDQDAYVRSTLGELAAAGSENDEHRQVCRRERTVGSQMVTRVCRSVGQMAVDREQSRDRLEARRICSNCSGAN